MAPGGREDGAGAATVTRRDAEFPPPALEAVSVTVKVPALVYVCDGLCAVLVEPSPKLHDQLLGTPVDVSVKLAVRPDVVAVKPAVGFAGGGGGGGGGGADLL
jgi:hypothetical protein